MGNFVYKIKRNHVFFQNEKGILFKYYQPNQRQVLEISKANGLEEVLKANEKLLRENLEACLTLADGKTHLGEEKAIEAKENFINELLENSTLEEFFSAMAEEFNKAKESKRKN
ncbi:hypothetical protein BKH41_02825 [Helicobacter sp. 12S02232-10]|uniref:hypothetical protein n=1 Tax=Helicobacter sp. 12S02232-10 TaxID=1476197 RepID=UPI000BA61506|nr:hypothetical protein [Helicobacter sp. 12S02232-10]PAF49614.1 hypothetical protein BKH41_02825 [Helicobacter sp. 12S02232-10]